jgi:8-oxo-dGTP diphosphatase
MSSEKEKKQMIPVLAAIIQNDQQQILIARRKPELKNGGKWEFPGGKLMPGESPEDCLRREINEEMGIGIKVKDPFHLVNFSNSQVSILLISYLCEFLGGNWELMDHDRVLWVERANLPEYDFSDADIPIMHKLQEKTL